MDIALQLYSVRDYTQTPDALKETLAKVRKCGYRFVETAGFYGMPAAELADLLSQFELKTCSTHTGMDALVTGFDAVVADHEALGAVNVGVPGMPAYYPRTTEGYAAFGQKLDEYAARLAEHNLTLSYHNHAQEFTDLSAPCGWDTIFSASKLLKMQLDTGNAFIGGADPACWLKKYRDRVTTIHYKDEKSIGGKIQDTAIGEGSLSWKEISALIADTGCAYIIVEVEAFDRDPWDILAVSYSNIFAMFK